MLAVSKSAPVNWIVFSPRYKQQRIWELLLVFGLLLPTNICMICFYSLRGKHISRVLPEIVGGADHVLVVCDSARPDGKVLAAFS